jgi:hypothetical protein
LEWALALNRQPLNLKQFLGPLRANAPDLVALRLDEHLSQRHYDDVGARLLAEALRHNTVITRLELPTGAPEGPKAPSDSVGGGGRFEDLFVVFPSYITQHTRH